MATHDGKKFKCKKKSRQIATVNEINFQIKFRYYEKATQFWKKSPTIFFDYLLTSKQSGINLGLDKLGFGKKSRCYSQGVHWNLSQLKVLRISSYSCRGKYSFLTL